MMSYIIEDKPTRNLFISLLTFPSVLPSMERFTQESKNLWIYKKYNNDRYKLVTGFCQETLNTAQI